MRKVTGLSVTKLLINVNAVSLNFNLREHKIDFVFKQKVLNG